MENDEADNTKKKVQTKEPQSNQPFEGPQMNQ